LGDALSPRVAPPPAAEYAPAFAGYVGRVGDEDILEALDRQTPQLSAVFAPLDAARADFRYAAGKWSPREMLGHLDDTERVMGYRAMAIARGETQPLPGFDENAYMENAPFFAERPVRELLQHFAHLRESHVILFRQLAAADWLRVGTANRSPVSVRALAWVMVGHVRHHLAVLAERYGIPPA
jgi:hypothetical protein